MKKGNQVKKLKLIPKDKVANSNVKITLKIDDAGKPDLEIEMVGSPLRCGPPSWSANDPGSAVLYFGKDSFEICIATEKGYQWILDDEGMCDFIDTVYMFHRSVSGDCQIPCCLAFNDNKIFVGKQVFDDDKLTSYAIHGKLF